MFVSSVWQAIFLGNKGFIAGPIKGNRLVNKPLLNPYFWGGGVQVTSVIVGTGLT